MGKKSKSKQKKDKKDRAIDVSQVDVKDRLKLAVGDVVSLQELNTTKFNGKLGKIVSLPNKHSNGRYGVLLEDYDKPIAVKLKNIFSDKQKEDSVTTENLRRQYNANRHLTEEKDTASTNQLTMMRTMFDMFMTEEKQLAVFGRIIDKMPNYHKEIQVMGYPYGVDVKWANEYLRKSYEESQRLPHMHELGLKHKKYSPGQKDVLKRLSGNHLDKLNWYFKPKTETTQIFPQQLITSYPAFMRHSYSNQMYRKEAIHLGTTHVAVGFVDLGILLEAEFYEAPRSSTPDSPLKFLGIEKSPYAIAKTLVIWELLSNDDILSDTGALICADDRSRCIIQVWFSATWDNKTGILVQEALCSLCSSPHCDSLHHEVLMLLRHWKNSARISVLEARKQIAVATSKDDIGLMLRKKDRDALTKYILTKDFGFAGVPYCGNLLMFSCPDGFPPLPWDETIFSAFNFVEVMKILQNNDGTIMDAAESYALDRIKKLEALASSGLIEVELICADVQDSLDIIVSNKPWTMSWSNVLDYMEHNTFHRLARACSKHGDTIHFGYSMNWPTNVFGTNIIDYAGEKLSETRAEIIENSHKSVKMMFSLLRWDRYLRQPIPTNPINITSSYFLEMCHYEDWCKFFFDHARKDGYCNVMMTEQLSSSLLSSTGNSTVYFTWTYDLDITSRGRN